MPAGTNNEFYVPSLLKAGAWKEVTAQSKGGADWRGHRKYSDIKYVGMHHTVTHQTRNWEQEVEVVRQIHMNHNGWGGIGYNFIISSQEVNGYAIVAKIGALSSIRAHTPNMKGVGGIKAGYGNWYIAGISLIGMLHQHMPTDAQMRSAHELVKELIYNEDARMPQLKDWNNMQPHKWFDATACPGMWDRYRGLVISPPGTTPPPEPEDPCRTIKAKLETCEKSNKLCSNALADTKKKADTYEAKNKDLVAEVEKLTKTTEDLKKQVEILEKRPTKDKYDWMKKQRDEYMAEAEKLQKRVDDLETKLEKCQESNGGESISARLISIVKKILEWLKSRKTKNPS